MVYLQRMNRLIDDIGTFLETNGFEYSLQIRYDFDVICVRTLNGRQYKVILPLEISADSMEKAIAESEKAHEAVRSITISEGYPIIIPEDRWRRQRGMMEARLLAHMEVFSQAYARNCEVRRIDKETAQRFLNDNHSYGYAACKYRYGLFLKRHTGHIAREIEEERFLGCARNDNRSARNDNGSARNDNGSARNDNGSDWGDIVGSLIAVATFSNARKWIKNGREIRSYEWTRYASIPDLRVSGGMGKLLKAFIKEVEPDDIMSYADLEWSEGQVYKALGFSEELPKEPVSFEIDPETWERRAIRKSRITPETAEEMHEIVGSIIPKQAYGLFYTNFGSRKLRLKLTDYQ